jgi:anti-sigma regulatory factor (Ser/Thr protein kinase)
VQATINRELRVSVPMGAGSLAELRWSVWTYLAAAEVAPGMIDDILIALHEAVANAIRHSGSESDVTVRVRAARARVTVDVKDEGKGIDPRIPLPPGPPSLAAEGGRGLYMIWSLMSSVRLNPGNGTHLVMVKELFSGSTRSNLMP